MDNFMGYVWTFIFSILLAFVIITLYFGYHGTKNKPENKQQVMEKPYFILLVAEGDTVDITIRGANLEKPGLTSSQTVILPGVIQGFFVVCKGDNLQKDLDVKKEKKPISKKK